MIQQTRRGLVTGLISLMAAPAIVRAASLMPVKAVTATPAGGFLTLKDWADRLEAARYWDMLEESNRLIFSVPVTEFRGIPLRFSN